MPVQAPPQEPASTDARGRGLWFRQGARAAVSLPLLVLIPAHIGFASLARETGLTLGETVFMTLTIWALPSMVVLIGAIQSGAALPAAFLAVTLSAVRLMPMLIALVPELRQAQTRRWVPYALSHFVAVTAWIMSMQLLPTLPRNGRTSFLAGLAAVLVIVNVAVVAAVHRLASDLPVPVSAAMLLLTPIYFLTSLWGSAREPSGRAAMIFGVVLGPVFHLVTPGADLLIAGIIGGGAGLAWQKLALRKKAP